VEGKFEDANCSYFGRPSLIMKTDDSEMDFNIFFNFVNMSHIDYTKAMIYTIMAFTN